MPLFLKFAIPFLESIPTGVRDTKVILHLVQVLHLAKILLLVHELFLEVNPHVAIHPLEYIMLDHPLVKK